MLPRRIDGTSSTHLFKDPKSLFKQAYYEALDIAIQELNHRFHKTRGMPIAATLERVLLNVVNADVIEGIPDKVVKLYENDAKIDQLAIQLQMLPDMIHTYNESHPETKILKVTRVRTICNIMNTIPACKSMLSEIAKLLNILLIVPVTTATAEQAFSTLRQLKSYLRSTFSQPHLNNLMLLQTHKDEIDDKQIAKDFFGVNQPRKNYFGTF